MPMRVASLIDPVCVGGHSSVPLCTHFFAGAGRATHSMQRSQVVFERRWPSLASGRPSGYFDGLEEPSQIFWLAGDLDGGPATHDLFQLSLVSCRDHKGL